MANYGVIMKDDLIWRKILQDTRAQTLEWHCGGVSDVWDARHKNYTIIVSDYWFSKYLTIRTFPDNHQMGLSIAHWEWRNLLSIIREPTQITQDDFYREMCDGRPGKEGSG
jgi:hypothetical protein